eukprot:TRINITY_DN355_c0_g4_i2.p1 TRINITY_DN355_c0_g4~~TRINITY_DN355_c0_g4_i2.p1  ORF type:complete len:429 (-),score=175.61 TRINITY_DN355_c0_g4_i2:512-1747(-)
MALKINNLFNKFYFYTIFLIFFTLFINESYENINNNINLNVNPDSIPTQIHLSWTGNPNEMAVFWLTQDFSCATECIYGSSMNNLNNKVKGKVTSYTSGSYSSGLIHSVILQDLIPLTRYYYQCGDSSKNAWSEINNFLAAPADQRPVTIGIVGDVGTTQHSNSTINGLIQNPSINITLLVGDLSYADGNQPVWDTFAEMIEPHAKNVAWMFLVGNHENEFHNNQFLAYKQRYQTAFYYSFDYSYVHFIILSSETDYSPNSDQLVWLKKDLSQVDRKKTPWIVAAWHRPWYSSNTVHQGEAESMRNSVEDLLYQYKVDLCYNGHVHAYERTAPIYNFKITADAPTYFTVGDGGNREGYARPWIYPKPEWSEFRIDQYGYGTLQIFNSTHMQWLMRRDDNYVVIDQAWFIKQ